MEFFVNITPLRAGAGEPVGEVEKILCPADVEPDTLLSFLMQRLGEPIEVAWTSAARHPNLQVGWIYPRLHQLREHYKADSLGESIA